MKLTRRLFLLSGSASASCAAATVFTIKGRISGILPAVPVNIILPIISGSAITGQTVTCSTGTWTNSPTGFTYQWKRAGSNIIGATTSNYVLQIADEGLAITCTVVASNGVGNSSPATTSAIFPIPSGIPVVTPAVAWTGVADSGFSGSPPTPSVYPLFTDNNKPVGTWLSPQRQAIDLTLTPTLDIAIMARTPSGIKQIDWYAENPTAVTTTVSSLTSIPILAGGTKIRDCYSVRMNIADFTHRTSTGRTAGINIYAKVTANDPSFDPLWLQPLRVIPLTARHDWIAKVSSTGNDQHGNPITPPSPGGLFTTLAAAEAALNALGTPPGNPVIMLMLTGSYPLVGSKLAPCGQSKSWCEYLTDTGITATLYVASAPDYTDNNTWPFYAPWARTMYGPGITIDQMNFGQTRFSGYGTSGTNTFQDCYLWENGNERTTTASAVSTPILESGNSYGPNPRYNTYWNGSVAPGFSVGSYNLSILASQHTDCTHRYINSYLGSSECWLIDGVNQIECTSNNFQISTNAIIGCYSFGNDNRFWTGGNENPAMTVAYAGAGSHTFTLQKDGGNGVGTITAKLDGTTVGTPLVIVNPASTSIPGTPVTKVTDVVAWLNAMNGLVVGGTTIAGLVAVGQSDYWQAGNLQSFPSTNGGSGFTPQTITTSPVQFTTCPFYHFEWMQVGNQFNFMAWGNISWGGTFGTTTLSIPGALIDSWFANNALVSLNEVALNGNACGSRNFTNVNNLDYGGRGWNPTTNDYIGQTSNFVANISAKQNVSAGTLADILCNIKGILYLNGGNANLTARDASNVVFTSTLDALLNSPSTGDFTPATASPILTNQYAPIELYDYLYNVRDPTGDWPYHLSKNYSTIPPWPT